MLRPFADVAGDDEPVVGIVARCVGERLAVRAMADVEVAGGEQSSRRRQQRGDRGQVGCTASLWNGPPVGDAVRGRGGDGQQVLVASAAAGANRQRVSVPASESRKRHARRRRTSSEKLMSARWHRDAEAARFQVRLFQRPVHRETGRASRRPAPRCRRPRPASSSARRAPARPAGARRSSTSTPTSRPRASAHTTRPALCARLKRSDVSRRGDLRAAVRTLAPAPAAGRDAERPADERRAPSRGRAGTSSGRRRSDSGRSAPARPAAATSSARATARRIATTAPTCARTRRAPRRRRT